MNLNRWLLRRALHARNPASRRRWTRLKLALQGQYTGTVNWLRSEFLLLLRCCGAVSAAVFAIATLLAIIMLITLFALSPWMPDAQEAVLKARFATAFHGAAIAFCVLLWAAVLHNIFNKENADDAGDAQDTHKKEPPPVECRTCHYYSADAAAWYQHGCAVHPSGNADSNCKDWQPKENP